MVEWCWDVRVGSYRRRRRRRHLVVDIRCIRRRHCLVVGIHGVEVVVLFRLVRPEECHWNQVPQVVVHVQVEYEGCHWNQVSQVVVHVQSRMG